MLGNRDNFTYNEDYSNQPESDGVWDYVYDDEGNMTGKEEIGTSLAWSYGYRSFRRNQSEEWLFALAA